MSFNHQDWEPVVLKKETKPKQPNINPEYKKMKELDSDDIVKPDLICPKKSKEIRELRNKKKITQKDLAKALNIQGDVITDIENGKYQKNGALFAKILTHLKRMPDVDDE